MEEVEEHKKRVEGEICIRLKKTHAIMNCLRMSLVSRLESRCIIIVQSIALLIDHHHSRLFTSMRKEIATKMHF